MTEYFCDGCLDDWRSGTFMEGCSTCQKMKNDKNWSIERVLEVWEPIVTYCNDKGLKAWVPKKNDYMPRIKYTNKRLEWLPRGLDDFSKQQRKFALQYQHNTTEENWNILHPTTQLLALRL